MSNIRTISVVLLCALIIGSIGCRPKEPAATPKTKTTDGPLLAPPQQQTAPATPQGDHAALPSEAAQSAGAETAEAAKIKANLASFSTADRALAEKQKVCPVSGEPLGAMGPPKKISVAGREVFICCPACEEPLTKEPAKYLAKVGLQPAQ